MKKSALAKNQPISYICQFYNVSSFMAGLATRGISRILTPFSDALNSDKNFRLPRFILIVPDKDLITSMKTYNFGTARVMGAILHYIMKQMDVMINRK